MRYLMMVVIILLTACNDETDVAIITGKFAHAAQFEQRGLTLTVFHLDDVVEELNKYKPGTASDGQVALKHTKSINNMAAGTVILNFSGGYQSVYDSLNKYPGRKIYCAGANYWNVDIPEGCIPIGSIYEHLNIISPISATEWSESGGANNPSKIILPTYRPQFYIVILNDDAMEKAKQINLQGWHTLALDMRNYDFDPDNRMGYSFCDQAFSGVAKECYYHEDKGYIIVQTNHGSSNLATSLAWANYWFMEPRPSCSVYMFAGPQIFFSNHPRIADFVDAENCWIGDVWTDEQGRVRADYSKLL